MLRCPRPLGTDLVCYADDTLILTGGRWWYETANLAKDTVACVVREIRNLGLCVSPAKSEVLGFYNYRNRSPPPPGLPVGISGEKVMVGLQMKYLGLIIDSPWAFKPHFKQLVPKVTTAVNALCGLLPNLGGAGLGVRRLYEGVIRSRVLYGAPIWAEDLSASRRSLALVRGLHRMTAIRIIRGYRTVSYASATVLATSPPFELQALALKRRYEGRTTMLQEGSVATPQPVDQEVIDNETWRRWRTQLDTEDLTRPHRAVRAVLPSWEAWKIRRGVPLTYRMTQILTGHGVFGEFLLRIRREVTSTCHHCKEGEDTTLHTLESCPAWEEPRRILRMEIGARISPEALVEAILRDRREYSAVRVFCERVMLAKEWSERERIRTGAPARVDRSEGSARRGGVAQPLPPLRTTSLEI
jgi:hypothetical protein